MEEEMKELFVSIEMTEENKSIQVTELPTGGIIIQGTTITGEGISGDRMALTSDSTKALIKMLKEYEERVL
jgi:hypothetical protein